MMWAGDMLARNLLAVPSESKKPPRFRQIELRLVFVRISDEHGLLLLLVPSVRTLARS